MAQLLLGAPPPPLAHPVRFHFPPFPVLSRLLPHPACSPLQCLGDRPVGHPAQPPPYHPWRYPAHQPAQRSAERPTSTPIPCPVGCLASSPVPWCRDHPRRLALWHGWPPSVPPAPPAFPLESFYSSAETCPSPLGTPAWSWSLGPWREEIPARPPGAPSDDQRHLQASLVSL